MRQEEQIKIIEHLQFLSYLYFYAQDEFALKKENFFINDFMSKNIDTYNEPLYVFRFLGLRNNRRNQKRILLPYYTTERVIDEHCKGLSDKWLTRKHLKDDEMVYFVDNNVDFNSFIISTQLRPQLMEMIGGVNISANNYTRFVYDMILLQERDYFDNILSALCKGSRIELQMILNNIHNGDSSPTADEMKMLIDAEVPYLIEFSDYIKENVFNPVYELIHDLQEPDIDCSDDDYKEIIANTLLYQVLLSINGFKFQITKVGIVCDGQDHGNNGGNWQISDNNISIFIGSEKTKRRGYILISKIECIHHELNCETPDKISSFAHYSMNRNINNGELKIKLIPFNVHNYHETKNENIE